MSSKTISLNLRTSRKLENKMSIHMIDDSTCNTPADVKPHKMSRENLRILADIFINHVSDKEESIKLFDSVHPNIRSIITLVRKKILGYKNQDIRQSRDIQSNVLVTTYETIEKLLHSHMKCSYCATDLVLDYSLPHSCNIHNSQWTLDRIDNSISHTSENTVVSCLGCNIKRGTIDYDVFRKNSNGYFRNCNKLSTVINYRPIDCLSVDSSVHSTDRPTD